MLNSAINKVTASVLNDFEERKELRQPENIRTKIRFSLTLAMAAVVILAIVILVRNQPSTKLSREVYKGFKTMPGFSLPSPPSLQNADSDVGLVNSPVQCPCSRQMFSWNNFTKIFSISKDSNGHLKADLLNGVGKYPNMCMFNGVFESTYSQICITEMQAFIGNNDQRTFIQSTNLIPPLAVQNEVYIQMKTNYLMQLDMSQYLGLNPTLVLENTYYRYISTLIGAMIIQQWTNTSSSIEDFWERAKMEVNKEGKYIDFSIMEADYNVALGMTINWNAYEKMCHPKICDHIYTYSLVSKIFHATSEVGGFLSIILFVVRAIVWPTLLHAFAFPRRGLEASNLPTTSL